VSRLQELSGGLEEDIDCDRVSARLCVSSGKSARFLMCFVRVARGYEWKDGLESSRGRCGPCTGHDSRLKVNVAANLQMQCIDGPGSPDRSIIASHSDRLLSLPANMRSRRALPTLPPVGPPSPKPTFLTKPSTINSSAPPDLSGLDCQARKRSACDEFRYPS
jgi:hypothetical protein